MGNWIRVAAVIVILLLVVGCGSGPKDSGIGAYIPKEEALRMARADSPLVEVTRHDTYTAPPTVHVIYGTDKDGRQLVVFVYTTVIRYVYANRLISAQRALEVAANAGFQVEAVRDSSLQVFQGNLDGRANPVFWKLGTKAGWIWIDAETETGLRRLDAQ